MALPAPETQGSQNDAEGPDSVADEEYKDRPFSDILGYKNYRINVEESTPYFYIWSYYVEIDGEMQCVAHTSAYSKHPGVYSVDLDGDGISEFITNTEYGDGAQRVEIYRNNNGVIECSGLVSVIYMITIICLTMDRWGTLKKDMILKRTSLSSPASPDLALK